MRILSIDPGSEHSGGAYYDIGKHKIIWTGDFENMTLLSMIRLWKSGNYSDDEAVMSIESIQNQGQIVGRTTFETAEWIGRFREAWEYNNKCNSFKISRRDVLTVMCGGSTYENPITGARKTVNDTIVSAAVRTRFPASGGGKRPEVGTKGEPGPLYGVKGSHQYSAIAIALTWVEIHGKDGTTNDKINQS